MELGRENGMWGGTITKMILSPSLYTTIHFLTAKKYENYKDMLMLLGFPEEMYLAYVILFPM